MYPIIDHAEAYLLLHLIQGYCFNNLKEVHWFVSVDSVMLEVLSHGLTQCECAALSVRGYRYYRRWAGKQMVDTVKLAHRATTGIVHLY